LSTAVLDIASEVELKAGSTSAAGNVLLAKKKVEWKPRSMERSRVPVETSQLFCASNDPLQHTPDDVGKFFQLEAGTALFELFYHIGFCGDAVEDRARRLQSSAMMVRERGLEVRDELLRWQRAAAAAAQETTRPHARRPGSRGAPHPEGSQIRLSESLRECCQSL
jgi:hypothetical protein